MRIRWWAGQECDKLHRGCGEGLQRPAMVLELPACVFTLISLAVSLLSAVLSLISGREDSGDVQARTVAIWHDAHVSIFFFPTVVRKYLTKQLKEGFMLIQLGYSPLWMGRLGSVGTRRHLQSQSRGR